MAALLRDDVEAIVHAATGRGPDLATWELAPAGHVENMTTDRLERLRGTFADGTPWSVFVKTLRPASDSPMWQEIPEVFRPSVLDDLNWLDEPRVYGCGLADDMPPAMRLPAIHRVDRTPSRVVLWMEDVDDVTPWDLERFGRCAEALGRLAGRWPDARATTELGLGRRPMGQLFFGKIVHLDLVVQADDAFWAQPAVAAVADARHRADLSRLADAMPALLARIEQLPHAVAHGDASPANFLDPGDGRMVAVDWSYGSVAPLGSDLGQLVAGSLDVPGNELPPEEIAEVVIDAYVTGLAGEAGDVDREAVELAFAVHLAVRSVFSALLLDHLPQAHRGRPDLLARRAHLARFGLDQAAPQLTLH